MRPGREGVREELRGRGLLAPIGMVSAQCTQMWGAAPRGPALSMVA